jgi:hypothetical protein
VKIRKPGFPNLAGFPVKSPHNPRERFSKLKPDTVKETQELHASCMLRKRISIGQ